MHVVHKTATQRWYGGYGPDQYLYYAQQGPKMYLGGTFEVEGYEELEKYVLFSSPYPLPLPVFRPYLALKPCPALP